MPIPVEVLLIIAIPFFVRTSIIVARSGWLTMLRHFPKKKSPLKGDWHNAQFASFGLTSGKNGPSIQFKLQKDGIYLRDVIFRFQSFIPWSEVAFIRYFSHQQGVLTDFFRFEFHKTDDICLIQSVESLMMALAIEPPLFEDSIMIGDHVMDSKKEFIGIIRAIHYRPEELNRHWKQYHLFLEIVQPFGETVYIPAFTIQRYTSKVHLFLPYEGLRSNGLLNKPKFIQC
ncbi:MAG: hypothetical protein AAF490_16965 [Chloroflexota bacterium]